MINMFYIALVHIPMGYPPRVQVRVHPRVWKSWPTSKPVPAMGNWQVQVQVRPKIPTGYPWRSLISTVVCWLYGGWLLARSLLPYNPVKRKCSLQNPDGVHGLVMESIWILSGVHLGFHWLFSGEITHYKIRICIYILLRTVHPTDSYYAKSSQSYGDAEVWSSRLVVRRVKEMMQLQLICCTLSNFSSSQFTRGSDKRL